MKIGFDAKRFFNNFTGLGNYSRFIIRALSEHAPENDYLLFTPKVKTHAELNSILSSPNIRVVTPPYAYSLLSAGSLWRTWGISRSSDAKALDLYHGLSQELPLHLPEKLKKIVTVHDLIFIRYPHLYKAIDSAIYKFKVQAACRQADRILAISQQTKEDIVHFLDIEAAKIDVVYQGCHPSFKKIFSPDQIAALRAKYDLPRHYILNVGTIEERKNVLLLIKAISLLPVDLRIHVVVVGRSTDYKRKIIEHAAKLRISQWIIFLHDVSFVDLPGIYQGAEVFVYPSIFEGFGIPIVEALESSVPVIAAKGSSLQEAGGPGTIYLDPENEQEMSETLKHVLSNEELKKSMIEEGRIHVKKFEPEVISDLVMKVYKKT